VAGRAGTPDIVRDLTVYVKVSLRRLPGLPIYIGGRAEAALQRAGRLADGYHSSATSPAKYAPRVPIIAAADEAGSPMPTLTARVRVQQGVTIDDGYYAARGTPEEVAAEVRAFADLGVAHVALWFDETDPARLVAAAERFHAEVEPLA
jgi:alkanesulfonate monooxygenase SsuD/methylene tetrahydromethanopterin reductase-like flavin-dependent oxidoreductase (luciferase family)